MTSVIQISVRSDWLPDVKAIVSDWGNLNDHYNELYLQSFVFVQKSVNFCLFNCIVKFQHFENHKGLMENGL